LTFHVKVAPPRNFARAMALASEIAEAGVVHELHHGDATPTREEAHAAITTAFMFCFQAGALWRDSYVGDEMPLDLS